MKVIHLFVCLAFLLGIGLTPAAAVVIPTFAPAEFITWGSGQIIQTEHNGVIPNVGDWNADGIKDILVGTYQSGNVYYYPNSGTNANPIFLTRSLLQADGSPISLTYG